MLTVGFSTIRSGRPWMVAWKQTNDGLNQLDFPRVEKVKSGRKLCSKVIVHGSIRFGSGSDVRYIPIGQSPPSVWLRWEV